MNIPKELLEQVASRYTHLRNGSGGKKYGLSPFREEKHPSFYIYPDGHYHDFGDGSHGDAIDLVMRMEHLSFTDALSFLEREYGVKIPWNDSKKTVPKKKIKPKWSYRDTLERIGWLPQDRLTALNREDRLILDGLRKLDQQALSAWGICDKTYSLWHFTGWLTDEWLQIYKEKLEEIENDRKEWLRNE